MQQDTAAIVDHAKSVLIGNYARLPVVMARGAGSRVWDTDGREYIDLFAGFGGAILGHSHPELVEAVVRQAGALWHVGNTFYTTPQVELAERLQRHAFDGRAFFCHSGLEANEAAVKLARLAGAEKSPKRWKVITFDKSFHGRSLAMISATGNPAVKAGFDPAVPGFSQVAPGDIDALRAAVDDQTAAIMFEPIQGEGGINLYPPMFAAQVRELCDQQGIALIFDEVWTGCGRTGRWFGHQHFADASGNAVTPDIMTLGKAVGGGLPVGIMWARPEIAQHLVPGRHGCTLGGNPICMAVSKTIFDVIERDRMTDHAAALGEYAMARLKNEKKLSGKIVGVRGKGLFIGVEFVSPPEGLVEAGLRQGVVINVTQKTVVRIAPPINISREDMDSGIDRFVAATAALH